LVCRIYLYNCNLLLSRSDGGFEISLKTVGPSPHIHFVRQRPFAAIIPGDGVAEQVITTGINQFLSLYNAALIGRLVLTWYVCVTSFIVFSFLVVVPNKGLWWLICDVIAIIQVPKSSSSSCDSFGDSV